MLSLLSAHLQAGVRWSWGVQGTTVGQSEPPREGGERFPYDLVLPWGRGTDLLLGGKWVSLKLLKMS